MMPINTILYAKPAHRAAEYKTVLPVGSVAMMAINATDCTHAYGRILPESFADVALRTL